MLTIVCLFLSRRPTTVVEAVASVVVDAVERQVIRRIAHVGIEIFKAVKPSVTDGDASTAIAFVGMKVGITHSRFHRFPNTVGPRVWFSAPWVSALAVFKSGMKFSAQTAARFGRAVQIVSEKGTLFSAFTFTEITSVWFAVDERDYGQSSELLTCEINGFGHKLDYRLRSA